MLSQKEAMQIARRLIEISERTGVRIVMVIVDTVGREPIEDYADRLAPRWARERAADPDRMIIVVIAVNDRYLVARPGRDLRLGTLVNPAELSQFVGRFFGQGRWYDGLSATTWRPIFPSIPRWASSSGTRPSTTRPNARAGEPVRLYERLVARIALLAQLCVRHELTLLTTDRDFEAITSHYPLKLWQLEHR